VSNESATPTPTVPAPALRPGQPLLSVDRLSVGYDGKVILPPITMSIGAGDHWAVIGPNGAGKSTFLRTVLGLEPPLGGRIVRAPGLRMSYVPQQSNLDPIFPVSVLGFVLMGRQRPGNVIGRWRPADFAAARTALAQAEAAGLEHRQLRDLSGGQRQRVAIARAIASDADLFFLDEPTAALDIASERQVLQLITSLPQQRGAAVVMVTHLVEDGLERAKQALLLDRDHDVALAAAAADMRRTPAFEQIYGRVLARTGVRP
jgi:zinc transport system ATP-binding protein